MSILLSSVAISSLSSCFSSGNLQFINDKRQTNYKQLSASLSGLQIKYPDFSKYIKNIHFDKNYYLFLTQKSELSSYLNTYKTFSSNSYGFDMNQINVMYNWFTNNFSTNFSCINTTQFLGIVDSDLNFNICPLKTKLSVDDSQYSVNSDYRDYQKIYNINNSLYLQFKVNKTPFAVYPDEYNLIFNSYSVLSSNIQNTSFVQNGAIGGDGPLNSDVIFFEQNEYGNYTNNGPNNINQVNNGTLLCLWLSSQTSHPSSNKIWMERWYDPNTVTQGQAFISQKNTLSSSFTYVVDVSSSKIISEKEKLIYLRYGKERNNTFINSFSSNLIAEFKNWDKNFSSTVNGISGYIIGDYPKKTETFVLYGTNHAHIPSVEQIFTETDFTVSLWANCNQWKNNNDSQFFGNYNNNTGYGIFYNTGTSNDLISIPTSSNNIFSLNNKGFKVFEKDVKQDLGLSSLNIEYIKTDLFGNRWLYDGFNKKIYKLENDDLLIKTIDLPLNSNIVKIDCNSNNEIFALNTTNNTISSFNYEGKFLTSTSITPNKNNFCIDLQDNIVTTFSNYIDVNSNNDIITLDGGAVSVNNIKKFYLPSLPNSFKIDLENNLWFLINNTLYKIDSYGTLLFKKDLPLPFINKNSEMCFVKSYVDNIEKIYLWIILNEQKRVLILDQNGDFFKNIDLTKLFVGNNCSYMSIDVRGDFSGFDNKRKFEVVSNKCISPKNPYITVRANLKCGDYNKIVRLHYSVDELDEWSNLSFSVKNTKESTILKLYINGLLKETKTISGVYRINYGYRVSPFIIGGNSGKLGAKNLEKSIVKNGYFIGEMDDIRIYNSVLNDFKIFNLSINNHYDRWKPINMYVDCPATTFIEEVNDFYINRYKGFKSNHFNIRIKNFTDNPDLQQLILDYIKSNINDFIPANTILNDIIFE